MKKILTILAATATMFAFGAGEVPDPQPQVETVDHGADFEAFTAGDAFSAGLNDKAQSSNPYYWYTADADAANIISNYTGSGAGVSIASRPDKFAGASNSKYLQVETTGKLYRTVKDNGGSPDFQSIDESNFARYAFSLTNSAIYLDTLVKFTAADSVFGDDDLGADDKIAIEYVEHESEGDGDPTVTNFVIRAGFKTSTGLIATNYYAYLPGDPTFANFDKDAWHRLTVRTIPDVGDGSVGFVVYVDETNLVYSTDVSAGYGVNDLDGTAGGFYNDDKHALFPSAVSTAKLEGKAISAAAFSGNGSLDDVVFTTSTPNFIKAGEFVVVTINKGTGITGVTVTVGDEEVAPVDAAANPLIYNLAPGTETFGLTATADKANGYAFSGVSGEDATWGTDTVTIIGPSPVLTVKATRNNVSYIDSEDQTQSTTSLAAAITGAKSGTTITLVYPINAAEVESAEFNGYGINGKNLVLDLNGNTITWNDPEGTGESLFNIATKASLTVIDSSASNTGKIVYGGEYGAFYNDGDCYVGAASGDYGPTIEGILYAVVDDSGPSVVRGKFDKVSNSTVGETPTFIGAADYIEAGSELKESLGDYWVVAPQGGGDEDWKDPSEITKDATAGEVYGITGDLAAADAVELTVWATGEGNVDFADKDTINVDCFLLNIANDSTAQQIQDEKDEFVVTISFDSNGDPVITAPDGKTYNGKLIIKGSDDLSIPKANWDEQTDGDTFFYGELSL